MPRDNSRSNEPKPAPGNWETTLLDRIRKGKVTPVISDRLGDDVVLGGHDKLVQRYASQASYPSEQASLARVAQFKSITDEEIVDTVALKENYVDFLKNRLFDLAEEQATAGLISGKKLIEVNEQFDDLKFPEFAKELGFPRLDDRRNPFLLLASLPFPIYVTTAYHHYLEAALSEKGKQPHTEICRWHKDLRAIPSVLQDPTYKGPSPGEPLVYHLHGSCRWPDSLVLTEDDHLQFLVATSEGFGSTTDPVYNKVRDAMNESLLLVGYSLSSWDFRSLFWGLIQKRERKLLSALTIQLEHSPLEELYLEKYMGKFEFKVY